MVPTQNPMGTLKALEKRRRGLKAQEKKLKKAGKEVRKEARGTFRFSG
jgi:hypothetical protein